MATPSSWSWGGVAREAVLAPLLSEDKLSLYGGVVNRNPAVYGGLAILGQGAWISRPSLFTALARPHARPAEAWAPRADWGVRAIMGQRGHGSRYARL